MPDTVGATRVGHIEPTVEEHPLPAVVMHWLHLLAFFGLGLTGLLIHFAPGGVSMTLVRNTHFLLMYVFVLTLVARVYWAVFGAGSASHGRTTPVRDVRHFLPEKESRGAFWPTLKYYLFLAKTRPYTPKYNPMQKLTYGWLFPLLAAFMSLTGFALYTPYAQALRPVVDLFGGLEQLRGLHYFTMWIMFVLAMIHLYLVFFEGPEQSPIMLFHRTGERFEIPAEDPAERA